VARLGILPRHAHPVAGPAKGKPSASGHAEFIFCDQSIERTFEWISQNRRMGKDHERLCSTGEAFIYAAMTRLMVRRLAHA
jgi:hypothetical protein